MKHISAFNILSALLLVILAAACTSDDVDQAYDLDGTWQGNITGQYYYDRYHSSTQEWDTEIQFVQKDRYSTTGYGVERDWTADYSYENDFEWEVRDGRIYINYDDGYRVIIEDYEIYARNSTLRFKGTFVNYDTGKPMAAFNLIKVADWSNAKTRIIKRQNKQNREIKKNEKDSIEHTQR